MKDRWLKEAFAGNIKQNRQGNLMANQEKRQDSNDTYQERKQASLHMIAGAVDAKQIKKYPNILEGLLIQLRYMEKRYLITQFVIAAVMLTAGRYLLMLRPEQMSGEVGTVIFSAEDGRMFLSLLSASVAVGSVLGILGISRILSYHMAEIEQTCYFNVGQLLAFRMIVYAVVNLLILTADVICISGWVRESAMEVLLYLTVPFVVANCGYLAIFTWIRGKGQTFALVGMAVLSAVVLVCFGTFPGVYYSSAMGIWLAVCAISLVLLAAEIHQMFEQLSEGENICLQWN